MKIGILILLLLPSLVVAQGSVGDNNTLLDFLHSYERQKLKKDEFESTDEFQRRISSYSGKEFVIVVPVLRESFPKPLIYNADTQILTVTLLGNASISPHEIIDPFSAEAKRNRRFFLTNGYAKFFLRHEESNPVRDYPASNAMGATAIVRQYHGSERSVALLNVPESPVESVKVEMRPDAAKAFVTRAMWRIRLRTTLIQGQRNFVLWDGRYVRPTISNPIEMSIDGKSVTALMLQAELVDPSTSEVIATFKSR